MIDAAGILSLLDKHAPMPGALGRLGMSPTQVRAVAAKFRPVELPSAEEARRGLARHTRAAKRGAWGRGGLPEHVWRAMYQEYCAGKSLSEVAAIFGGTRQSVHEVFRHRGLKLRPRHLRLFKKIDFGGRSYTPHKGYYRATCGDREPLHHAMWIAANGPIPDGCQVTFKNADCTDLRLENFACMPIADVTRFHMARHSANRT